MHAVLVFDGTVKCNWLFWVQSNISIHYSTRSIQGPCTDSQWGQEHTKRYLRLLIINKTWLSQYHSSTKKDPDIIGFDNPHLRDRGLQFACKGAARPAKWKSLQKARLFKIRPGVDNNKWNLTVFGAVVWLLTQWSKSNYWTRQKAEAWSWMNQGKFGDTKGWSLIDKHCNIYI